MRVRAATPDDRVDAVRILDGALLEVADVGTAIERGDVLVACVDGPDGEEPADERVVGVIVLEPHDDAEDDPDATDESDESGTADGTDEPVEPVAADTTTRGAHVAAVAVNPSRRGRGIGSALVEAARDRYERLTADFRPEVEPFWRALGFEVDARDDRCWGERT